MTETEDVLNQKPSIVERSGTENLASSLENVVSELVKKVEKIEERLNLMMALRQNKLDLSKFTFQLEPL